MKRPVGVQKEAQKVVYEFLVVRDRLCKQAGVWSAKRLLNVNIVSFENLDFHGDLNEVQRCCSRLSCWNSDTRKIKDDFDVLVGEKQNVLALWKYDARDDDRQYAS